MYVLGINPLLRPSRSVKQNISHYLIAARANTPPRIGDADSVPPEIGLGVQGEKERTGRVRRGVKR